MTSLEMLTKMGLYDPSLPESKQCEAYYKMKPIIERHIPNAQKVAIQVLELLINTVQKSLSEVEKKHNKS